MRGVVTGTRSALWSGVFGALRAALASPPGRAITAAGTSALAAAAQHAAALHPLFLALAPAAPHALAIALIIAVYCPPVPLARLVQAATGVVFDCTAFAPSSHGGGGGGEDASPSSTAGAGAGGGSKQQQPKKKKKYVALTIDDGPCAHTTGRILDVLAAHGARATMFVIGGNVERLDALSAEGGAPGAGRAALRDMVARGHELGNHTWCAWGLWFVACFPGFSFCSFGVVVALFLIVVRLAHP